MIICALISLHFLDSPWTLELFAALISAAWPEKHLAGLARHRNCWKFRANVRACDSGFDAV